ncbi:MAG: DedA family protein [Phycisphaerae bacterium]
MWLLAFLSINFELILSKSLYIGMLLLLFAASLGVPLPEDIPLLLGGALCRLGYGEVRYAILIGMVGVLSGDIVLYYAGRRFGMDVLKLKPFRALLTPSHIAHMKLQFRKRGNWIIFFGRFFAGVRSIMCVTAGMCKVPAWKFILIDFTGALCSVPLLISLGWVFSDRITKVTKQVATVEKIFAGMIALTLLIWILYIHLSKRSKLKQVEKGTKEDIMSDQPLPENGTEEKNETKNDSAL